MVLLYGIPGDGPFELVADALESIGTPFIFFNPRRYAELDFILYLKKNRIEGEISIGAVSYPLHVFTGIYNRAIEFESIPEAGLLPPGGADYHHYHRLFQLFNQWMEIADCKVVNKSSAMTSNASKPYQLSLIKPFFDIPETLLTNSPEDLNKFRQKYEEVIYKSASSIRSVVKSIPSDSVQNFQNIKHCPTLFQQRLRGSNYRVHVIGEHIFAVKADTASVDYRYSSREGNETILQSVDLPVEIEKKCILLTKSLQLVFAGIDLFLTDDGKWYCFEVNPSPGFSYFESATDQPIAETVAHYLS